MSNLLKNKVQILVLVIIVLLLMSMFGCSSSTAPTKQDEQTKQEKQIEKYSLDFMAGEPSGDLYPLAVRLVNNWEKHIPQIDTISVLPGAGLACVMGVEEGKAEMGLPTGLGLQDGYAGREPFTSKTEDVFLLASVMPRHVQFMVNKDGGINSIQDLVGKRLGVGPRGGTPETTSRVIFEALGVDINKVEIVHAGFADLVEEFKNGRIDAIHLVTSMPYALFVDAAMARDVSFIGFTPGEVEAIRKLRPALVPSILKGGGYRGVDQDIPTLATTISIAVHRSMPEDLIYEMTKVLVENFDFVKEVNPAMKDVIPEDLAVDLGVPFHPGALKYYQEKGWIK
ncbi:MAG: TAXI family TRAP transporter solute-binding subunit [Bacillota bacterium]|nr:TAXI family TRAP transporter solute-binding subunit [Bacillota bacterium]